MYKRIMYRRLHKSCTGYTVEPPIKDPPRKGRPPYKGHSSRSLYHSINVFDLRKEDNLQDKDRDCVPKVSFIQGSTVDQIPHLYLGIWAVVGTRLACAMPPVQWEVLQEIARILHQ